MKKTITSIIFLSSNCNSFTMPKSVLKNYKYILHDTKNNLMNEDTLIIDEGYDPKTSMGSLSTPIYKSSTFCFDTAEEGERSFRIAYGIEKENNKDPSLIYTRIDNPNMRSLENKISILDNSEKSLVFSSGMAAISNTCMTFLRPGDTVFFNEPVYGGSDYLFRKLLPQFNVNCVPFESGIKGEELNVVIKKYNNVKMVYIETPCNPLNILTSINNIKKNIPNDILIAVDNTFAGPTFLKPLNLGADLVLYSMTKFMGGHSDIVAGCVSGKEDLITKIKGTRTIMGTILDPEACWLAQRSLFTLKLRMNKQCENAKQLVSYLLESKHVRNVFYPGLSEDENQKEIYKSEYSDSGSLISFEINGDKEKAFKILNSFKVVKLAVSLGSIETLIQHPSSMTHCDVKKEDKLKVGMNDSV